MKIVFATHNRHKVEEVQAVLGPSFQLVTAAEAGITAEIPETQPTIEGNASQKARYVYEHTGLNCFADDTGLEVEALDGAPGVYSARYAGEHVSYGDNNALLLKNLDGKSNRRARFRTVISLIVDGQEHLFEGTVEGVIAAEPLYDHLRGDVSRGEKRDQPPRPCRSEAGRFPARGGGPLADGREL